MVRWVKITRSQYFGFFALGLVLLALQELPYIIMPLIPLKTNPLMEMRDKSAILNIFEKTLGVSCVLTMLFVVKDGAKWFSLGGKKETVFFFLAAFALGGYYAGWAFYFMGHQGLPLIICALVALPPVYYAFIGLWRGNYALTVTGALFLAAHISNVLNNLR